jgi:diguanylate cyclase (GGDEF)-like protein
MSDALELYRENGISDTVGKPFTAKELWGCLIKYLTNENSSAISESIKPAPAIPEKNGSRYKILIIDDDVQNISVLKSILGEEYEVFAEVDSREAVNSVKKIIPDVIILDIVMPDLSGYDVIKLLKSTSETSSIPVIYVTGLERNEDEATGLKLGAADYISKPFYYPVVQSRVQNQIKIIEQFREIERLSMYDQLTNLPNRHCFEMRIKAEWGRALRTKTPISLLLVDVDNFKNYNDSYGHQQGDVALQSLSEVLRKTFKRPADLAARWGGEEFIVLLPETDSDGAFKLAEQLRASVESMAIPCTATNDESAEKITVSVGVNTQKLEYTTIDKLISDADMQLYEAKNNGRNRVI